MSRFIWSHLRRRAGWPRLFGVLLAVLLVGAPGLPVHAQSRDEAIHRRGRLWEDLFGYGWIGNGGAWDFLTPNPLGMFPGFEGYMHPFGSEFDAVNTYSNANFHNFKSGVWIMVKDVLMPGTPPTYTPTPTDYEFFAVASAGDRGVGDETTYEPIRYVQNFQEQPGFNPLLPEEWTVARWHTNTGISVTRRSAVWSYPGYSDFIIYDYVFKNTGQVVSRLSSRVVTNPQDFQQTLRDVYFAFHSAISVSTKSQINFHSDLAGVAAGAFGWKPPYHDYYHIEDNGTLVFSTNYNGGKEPPPFDTYPIKDNRAWAQPDRFGPELQSPAAFGWLALYADPTGATPRSSPRPDVLRIDSHKGGTFQGQALDMEFFNVNDTPPRKYYEFVTTPGLQEQLGNNGDRFNFYTLSYGPYTLAPGDSVRIVLAEIAGVMDYHQVIAGDPEGHFPDSTIAAIKRNAQLARNAVAWGLGAVVDGIPIAADAPEPPPAPRTDAVNASRGSEEAVIAVTWDDVAETTTITDGAGAVFYAGRDDLDGYRIYRSTDFQYTSDDEPAVLRGGAWTLIADIPIAEADAYWDPELGLYKFEDRAVSFGRRYGYYVAAYDNDPRPWTSANGTVVPNLPPLESGSHRRTPPTGAQTGPVTTFDVYVVPNPYVAGDPSRSFGGSNARAVQFRNLPERATIRIYTVSGDLIRTIRHAPDDRGNLSGSTDWDLKSDSGLTVAPGLYIYHVISDTEGLSAAKTGKIMIIR